MERAFLAAAIKDLLNTVPNTTNIKPSYSKIYHCFDSHFNKNNRLSPKNEKIQCVEH